MYCFTVTVTGVLGSKEINGIVWHGMCDIFNCNWVATRWQQYSSHLHTNNTSNNTIDTKPYIEQHNSLIRNSAGRAPSLRGMPWHLPYNWGKKHGKTSVRVAVDDIMYIYICVCVCMCEYMYTFFMLFNKIKQVNSMYILISLQMLTFFLSTLYTVRSFIPIWSQSIHFSTNNRR